MENLAVANSEKLVMCDVINDSTESSKRFVEIDQFKLWHSHTIQKHNLSIDNICLCLWRELEEADNGHLNNLLLMADNVFEVNKISVTIYDQDKHNSHTCSRFALKEDTQMVRDLLLSHMEKEFYTEDQYEIQIEQGFCFTERHSVSPEHLVLGLSIGL